MTWLQDHWSDVFELLGQHVYLAGVPLVLGLLVAVPLGWVAQRLPRLRTPIVVGTGLLYTVPSIALFILMPSILGTGILDPVNVLVSMTIYTVALLTRTASDALEAVPESVRLSADAMGVKPLRRLFTVDLPLAVPVLAAGLRVAAVSNVSIVSVAALIGVPQLGQLFTDGFSRDFMDPLAVGVVGCLVLALVFDLVIVVLARLATPWHQGRTA
ncbi:MAG TPA: ABC transporter permease [Nocardioidaceae bacterium]|nr:ABC transporter permease [Nocardioidaceae bacterium]